MGSKYAIYASKYPYNGCWDISYQCKTFREAVKIIKKLQKQGYNIIDLLCRDI